MAESIDEILNGSDEGTDQVIDQQVTDDNEGQGEDQSTGEEGVQVAAEGDDQTDAAQQQTDEVRTELKALAKERERIRQKEAALDAELAKLQVQQQTQQTAGDEGDGQNFQPADLKMLRKQYREALAASLIDPSDEEAAKLVEDLDEQIEAVRVNQITQAQKTVSVQEKAAAEFTEVFDAVHVEYPFLDPDHPEADAGLNADINAFYDGLLKRGESKAVALRKAVDTFAPAQAKKLGLATTTKPTTTQKPAAQAAAGVAREKLKGGFSEVPGTGSSSRTSKLFTGPTPMEDILGRSST